MRAIKRRVVLVVLDGLRPDSINADDMPILTGMAETGVQLKQHHGCYPTKTRVASAVLACGCYPGTHGLVNNELHCPETLGSFSAGSQTALAALDASADGPLLSVPTLAEEAAGQGLTVCLATASSSGTSFLQNPRGYGLSVNHAYVLPADQAAAITQRFGPAPEASRPNTGRNRYAVQVLTEYMLPELNPDLGLVWLSDPDKTQHGFGPGAPETRAALREVDRCLGTIAAAVEADGGRETDLFVVSDHGFVSPSPSLEPISKTVSAWLEQPDTPNGVLISGNSIYLDQPSEKTTGRVIRFLQGLETAGPIFSAYPAWGTFPLSLLHLTHKRSPDLYFTGCWDTQENRHGVPGTSCGVSSYGHGGTSPYELSAVGIGCGPNLRAGTVVETATGNVDIAPTLLYLLGCPIGATMEGRVLHEALRCSTEHETAPAGSVRLRHVVEAPDCRYRAYADMARVGSVFYLREANRC